MTTRRDFVAAAGAVGFGMIGRNVLSADADTLTAPRPRTAVSFSLPQGATDTHVHIIGNLARYPFTPKRAYTPPEASVDELRVMHKALGLQRVVIVQPSFYGTDNSCTVDAVKRLGASARGIAVIDDKTSEADLDDMHRNGIRGVRLNLATAGITDPGASARMLNTMAERIRRLGWHVQVNTKPGLIAALKQDFSALPVPVVFDHFGGADGVTGADGPGFETMVELVRAGKAYVKISAAYSRSNHAVMARALIAANPDRILWGSNWPHPGARQPGRAPSELTPWRNIDDGSVINLLPTWEPDAGVRRMILTDNPARLFEFAA